MEEFPHLVQVHNKYASQGLVTISVSTDPASKIDRQNVLDFLRKQHAAFDNYVLADGEDPGTWQQKLCPEGQPLHRVYDKQGNAREFLGGRRMEEIENYVAELLKQN